MQGGEKDEQGHGADEEDPAAELQEGHRGEPQAPAVEHERALDLLRRGRQHEEVQGEEDEDRDQVDEPLEDDGGEAGRGRDRVPPGDEPGPEQLARAGHEQAGREADHGGGEQVRVAHAPQRGEEVPPAPGAHGVDGYGDEDEPGEKDGVGAPEGLAEGVPVDPAEEESQQGDSEEGPDEEAATLPLHRLSALLTKPFRSDT